MNTRFLIQYLYLTNPTCNIKECSWNTHTKIDIYFFTFIFTIEFGSDRFTSKMNLNSGTVSPKGIFYPSKLCNFIQLGFCKMNEEWKKDKSSFWQAQKRKWPTELLWKKFQWKRRSDKEWKVKKINKEEHKGRDFLG